MPRHSTLIPLSHDHHEALLIALRLKKGGPASTNDRLWPADLKQQVRSLLLFFEHELLPHFKLEEEILFPLASTMEELQPLVEKLLVQHTQMRSAMGNISELTGDDDMKKNLSEFGALLESHVRTEERELFPQLEEAERQGRVVLPNLK